MRSIFQLACGIGLSLALATSASAQSNAVTNAILSLQNGKLDEAKENIDKAVRHEKTTDKPKTWYNRGMIYVNLAQSPLENYRKLGGDSAGTVAYESFRRAMELDVKQRQYYKDSEAQLPVAANLIFANSVDAYNAGNYKRAIALARQARDITPADTNIYRNLAVYAAQAEDYQAMREANEKLIELGADDPVLYRQLIYVARAVDEDKERALQIVEEARQKYPDNKDLVIDEIQLYQDLGRSDELKRKIEAAVENDPENTALALVLATLYDNESSDTNLSKEAREKAGQQAKKMYELVLKSDPDNYDALYNLGVIHYNKRGEVAKRGNNMSLKEYQKNEKQLEAEQKKHLNESLGYFERAYKIRKDDPQLVRALSSVYTLLKRQREAEQMDKRYEELTRG